MHSCTVRAALDAPAGARCTAYIVGVKRLGLLAFVLLVAGCGGSGTKPPATTSAAAGSALPDPGVAMAALIRTDPALAGKVRTLFEGSGWTVVQSTAPGRASAIPFHLVGGNWLPDRSRRVTITILGPPPGGTGQATIPQVAMEVSAHTPLVETALWVDGTELLAKGGGTPTSGTIYGAPAKPLSPGYHVAVGYARTATAAAAVAWRFEVS